MIIYRAIHNVDHFLLSSIIVIFIYVMLTVYESAQTIDLYILFKKQIKIVFSV